LADGLESTRNITDDGGTVTQTYNYDAFGAERPSPSAAANEFRFTGEQADKNSARGQIYLRARHYDPSLGRFLSKDPLSADPGWGGQVYGYANSNPALRVDPSGLDPGDDGTPPPGNADSTPVPVPGVSPRISDLCSKGYLECVETLVKEAQETFGGGDWLYNGACGDAQDRCLKEGYFDFGFARQKMGLDPGSGGHTRGRFPFSIPKISLPKITVPNPRTFLPETGSGGYLPTPGKETSFVCAK
jgi:RHS repeat-associated protein